MFDKNRNARHILQTRLVPRGLAPIHKRQHFIRFADVAHTAIIIGNRNTALRPGVVLETGSEFLGFTIADKNDGCKGALMLHPVARVDLFAAYIMKHFIVHSEAVERLASPGPGCKPAATRDSRLSLGQPLVILPAMRPTQNLRVKEAVRLLTPRALKAEVSATEASNRTVVAGREVVARILERRDPRMLAVVGPCSIHDLDGALEYGTRLSALRQELQGQMEIIMRVYFEKPRTTIGWKGLINDPHLDGSYDIEYGLKKARRLLLELTAMGLPAGTEFLDPIIPQYIDDLVTWAAIGARTTESQTHREMASGLSMPVGYKNATDGSLQIALDAMLSARASHSFLGIDQEGITSIIRTTGNPVGHLVLRGGRSRPNYDAASLRDAEAKLAAAGLPPVLMVDCSHANSGKQHTRQEEVWRSAVEQRAAGNQALIGLMLESYLEEGNQPFPSSPSNLRYGLSITDACVGWEATERMLRWAASRLRTSSPLVAAA